MTAVEWLIDQLKERGYVGEFPPHLLFEQAKEMEKQMVIDMVEKSRATGLTAEYLLLTYGSKGSDKEKQKKLITEIMNEDDVDGLYGSKGSDEHIVDTNEMVKPATISKKEMVEISDEEIETLRHQYFKENGIWSDKTEYFIKGAKWYREQLKKKQ